MTSDFLPGAIKTPLFIPAQICRDYELPNSSFNEIDKNTKVTLQALKNLSNNITFSYAKSTKNREQLPSPYLHFEEFQPKILKAVMTRKLNHIDDHKAPNIDDYTIKQGIKTLQNQMSCAFKGFVGRLCIDDFDTPHIGINRQQQGKLIHKVLETFFGEIQTGKELLELPDLALNDLIEKHINLAILKIPKSNFKLLEKTRLVKLIKQYLELEKQRGDFEVIKTESTSEVDINGLTFTTRLDRMDRLENNEKLIIDYKSGAITVSKMIGNPIEQAQLPIYAISNTVDGVAFAAINPSDCQFKAITKNKSALPLKPQTKSKMPEWDIQLMEWHSALNSASDDFQNGIAKVLPAKNACEFCDYDLLCRVEKSPNH
jgi:RecB family exonuclease